MAEFIRRREVIHHDHYSLFFPVWSPGWGFSFDCTEDGTVIEPGNPDARDNLRQCQAGRLDDGTPVGQSVLHHWTSREVIPAAVRCHCGAAHELTNENGMGDSRCRCGQWRNSGGQSLVDPENWGEETGETFSDDGQYVHGDFHDYGPEGA